MAAMAHLKGEERLGLGVAVAAHVALFAALLWHANREPFLPLEMSHSCHLGFRAMEPSMNCW